MNETAITNNIVVTKTIKEVGSEAILNLLSDTGKKILSKRK